MAFADGHWDGRGDFLNNDPGFVNFQFMTVNTPNTGIDVNVCVTNLPPMPCVAGANKHAAARSFHTGGVHALMGDGTVRFVNSRIDLLTWRALGSMNGRETVGEF